MKQRSIRNEARVSGVGLHTGNRCNLVFRPAPPGTGIVFERADLPGRPRIPADAAHVVGLDRGTSLGVDGAKVHTVEHVLAAAAALAIDNLVVELDANEPPVGDGSALPFFRGLQEAGTVEYEHDREVFHIDRPFHWKDGAVEFTLVPSDHFQVTFSIDFDHPVVGRQTASFDVTPEVFEKELAPARTFGFLHEVERLKEAGLIRGGSLDNAIVIGETEIVGGERLRFPDEFVRHKILDLIGDLALFGRAICAHVISKRSGHKTNVELVRVLQGLTQSANGNGADAPRRSEEPGEEDSRDRPAPPRQAPFGVEAILDLIPHRFPFLLVDRVLELEPERRIVGVKNVTINEPFFGGHFPGRPIMPGVLIVEAMGQVGGLLLMNSFESAERKLVYFTGLDDVKFRRPVLPGDQLRIEMELVRLRGRTCRMRGAAYVENTRVAEAVLTAVVVDRDPPSGAA